MLPLHHGGLPMGAMGLEPIPPVLETGCLPFGEAPADDGGRSCTGVFSLCGGVHGGSATPSPGRNGGGRTLSCRATACRAAGTPRSSLWGERVIHQGARHEAQGTRLKEQGSRRKEQGEYSFPLAPCSLFLAPSSLAPCALRLAPFSSPSQ